MPHLTEKQRKEVLLSYKLDNSKTNIAKLCGDYNITKQAIFNLAKNKKLSSEVEKTIIETSKDFTKRAEEIINLLLDRIEKEIKTSDKVNLSQLSTTLGILYDKARLEQNLSTNNSSINIRIQVEK